MAGPNVPGGDLAAQLMQLAGPILQSPQGQAMAQALLSQIGGGGGGAPDPRAAMAGGTVPGPAPGRAPAAMASPMGDGVDETMGQNPSAEDELAMVQQMMGGGGQSPQPHGPGESDYNDNQGHTGLNPDGPTPEEIQMLQSNPSERNVRNFIKLFGAAAADQALGGGSQGGGRPTSYEDDARDAMKGHRARGEELDGTILDEDD